MYPKTSTLLAFSEIAKHGQFKLAASHLNLTESAVSHQISRLEADLSVQLFERNRKGARLTDAGEIFYRHISLALNEIESGVSAITSQNETLVSISAPRTFAAMWLAPRISEFSAIHPDIDLQITATDRMSNLRREDIDLAFRVTDQEWHDCTQSFLCDQSLTPIANPKLTELAQSIGWNEVIAQIPLIQNNTHPTEWHSWAAEWGVKIPTDYKFRQLESYDLVQAAAIRGFGIAMARFPLECDAIEDGRLRYITPDKVLKSTPYHLLKLSDRKTKRATKVFMDWAQSAIPKT
jgi:DNA-binding transcriptional LysR family regulator